MGFVIVGCGGGAGGDVKLAKAGGSVTYNGGPIAGATVVFMPDKGPLALGVTDMSGEFKLNSGAFPGCAVGAVKVAVKVDAAGDDPTDASALTPPKNPQEVEEYSRKVAEMQTAHQKQSGQKKKSLIPPKYKDVATSGLNFTVDADSSKNSFKIELKD